MSAVTAPRTLFEKIWDAHIVREATDGVPAILYIDLHLIHEVTSPQAFTVLRDRGLRVRHPERTLATMDHSTSTMPSVGGALPTINAQASSQLDALANECAA